MAESLIYNNANEILKKLGSMVNQEIKLMRGAKKELHKFESTVSRIKAVLLDAEKQQATNHEVADWLEKLNDVFYDARDLLDDLLDDSQVLLRKVVGIQSERLKKVRIFFSSSNQLAFSRKMARQIKAIRERLEARDLLDEFSAQALRRKVMTQSKRVKKVRIFFSSSNQLAFSRKMTREIKAIRERLDAIASDNKFYFTQCPIIENTEREETDHSFVHKQTVIGRDADKAEMVKLLLNSNNVQENVSVVAIVGIGGLGKTTLAQLVYNDENVTKYFELKMWVCVSDPFDVKLIAQNIIESATCKKPDNLLMDKIQENLRKEIDGKKLLLVLDDVWNDDHGKWLELKILLMGGSKGSKILITTRSEIVADVTCANSRYLLQGLSSEESWSLFKQMTFRHREESETLFQVTIGREIVQKCRGVPLAIKAIGSLLYTKDTEDEWLFFKNNDLLKIAQEDDSILPILKLCYDYLPSHLKECFALCSLYLKGEEIHKRELIQLWIAHGLIQSGYENQTLGDVGDLYFMNLLRRYLFQKVKKDKWGDIISCKMHDLVHDVAESVVRPKSSVVNSNVENISEGTRHLSLHLSKEIPTHLFRAHKLRTLKMVVKSELGIDQDFERIFSTFKRLRVLNVDCLEMNVVPSNVSKMKYLRYLDLSGNAIKSLSSSVTKLQNLQTLKLNGCRGLEQLPRDIKKLVSLRHLELDECYALTGMPCGLGQLTCLLTLTRFVADSHSRLSELQILNNLGGRLVIKVRQGEDLKKATTAAEGRMQGTNYLEAQQNLKKLELQFDLWFDWNENNGVLLESLRPHPNLKELIIQYYGGVSFPSWMMVDKIGLSSALPNLVSLSLFNCNRCKHLPLFGQLPSLQFLRLWGMKSVEYIDNSSSIGSGGEESSGGGAIRISEPTPTFFPSLKGLELYGLPKLKGWWRSEAAAEEGKATLLDQHQHQHLKLPSFPSLSMLSICNCPNLASMPILQPCLEDLELGGVSKKLVEQELMMTTTDTVATSSSSSLQFPQGLSNLTDLNLTEIPKMVSLPVGLKHLTTLQTLEIESCDDLMALPEWIGNLTSLEQLQIEGCPKLTSLPDGMRQLTALQQLTIGYCSQVLYDRCQRETGEDWPKIAHIPNVHVSPSQI